MATESSEHDSEFIPTLLCHLSEDSGVFVCLQVPLSSPELGFVFFSFRSTNHSQLHLDTLKDGKIM